MVRVPSFFLYAADPLGGAIVLELDSFHCPERRIGMRPSGEEKPEKPSNGEAGEEEGQRPSGMSQWWEVDLISRTCKNAPPRKTTKRSREE
jgi:hypothetical protein